MMKIISFLAALNLLLGLSCNAFAAGFGEQRFTHDGIIRLYTGYTPDNLNEPAPLVILLHGGGGNMNNMVNPLNSMGRAWRRIADENGLILLAPNGTNARSGDGESTRQNWNDLRTGRLSRADDAGYILALIEHIAADYQIDRNRIYVTGPSNGGMMTMRLLVEHPDIFAAGVAFIANLPAEDIPAPSQAVPIMIVNGTEDAMVPYEGGRVGISLGRGNTDRGTVRSTDETMNYWLSANATSHMQAVITPLPDLAPDDGCRLIEHRYAAPPAMAETILVVMQGGGHLPPSTRQGFVAGRALRGGSPCHDADGPEMTWNFMQRQRK